MNLLEKLSRFLWRASRNTLCMLPFGRRWLFPQEKLSARFGRGDAEYAWRVFAHHFQQLQGAGFISAKRLLEIGPGRNLGTALLWWAYGRSQQDATAEIVCWDVFNNAKPESTHFWNTLASELLETTSAASGVIEPSTINQLQEYLREVEAGLFPRISYQVLPLKEVERFEKFDLVYSQAAIEHVWFIEPFWDSIFRLTADGGWHSHRIDLADHGQRENNYIEMLQWSDLAYWLTMRFVPGAINRWRAVDHLKKLKKLGFFILWEHRDRRDELPVPRHRLARPLRNYDEEELRTTGLDVVARKNAT